MTETKFTAVNLRKSNPTFYHLIMVLSLGRVALALNFWLYKPTFQPYGIHKAWAGAVFCALGVSQLVFLHLWRDIRKIRLVLATSAAVLMVWGLVNTQQWFAGKASLQLPIVYVVIAVVQIILLVEPPVNPMTEKK